MLGSEVAGKTPLPYQGGYGATQTFPGHLSRIVLGTSTVELTIFSNSVGKYKTDRMKGTPIGDTADINTIWNHSNGSDNNRFGKLNHVITNNHNVQLFGGDRP